MERDRLSQEILENVTHPELVIGLVGPIGVNMDEVQSSCVDALAHVRYSSEIIHITEVLKKYSGNVSGPNEDTDYGKKIDTANAFCRTANDGAALAALAMAEIREIREELHSSDLSEGEVAPAIPKKAYIIRQLKRRDEIELLRKVYGDKFIQISVSLEKECRVRNLITKLGKDHPDMRPPECEAKARELIEVDEHEEETDFGQEVRDIFHLGDFFVDAENRTKMTQKCVSFIRAFFGHNSASPSRDEFGAYMAASASLRSIDLSRQVGAAITSIDGDIIALGCNEVPKAFGGNYWVGDDGIARDFERGVEQNSIEKQRIIIDFINKLQKAGFVKAEGEFDSPEMKEKLSSAVSDALVSDITEYGRMTHAEMSAICDAARLGLNVKGATIYVTTFPCHNCAKHIVASGIVRVVFVEPYPKSKASSSHYDSISLDERQPGRVKFVPFEGIAPTRYRSIFEKGKRKKGPDILDWYEDEPRPRIQHRDNLHIRREAIAATEILKALKDDTG